MLKYVDAVIGLQEVPSEISLCINFSNCPNSCKGCHSKYLQEDIGTPLDKKTLIDLINKNEGITCVCLMGGDRDPLMITMYAKIIKENFPYKVAWYSGYARIDFMINLDYFDYIKLGPYSEELGGLDSPTTNQRMYKIENITSEFYGRAK